MSRSSSALFIAGLMAVLLAAAAVKAAWLANFDDLARGAGVKYSLGVTHDYLSTSDGPFAPNHPVTRNVLRIYFPGYRSQIENLNARLFEPAEFAVVSLLLDDGRQVRVNIPRHLPFRLARMAPPDVLILGSSRTAEGIRPDIMAREIRGVGTVLNASVAEGPMRTLEILLDRFALEFGDRKPKLLIVAVDDVSFADGSENYNQWIANLRDLDRERAWKHPIEEAGRFALQHFPRLSLNAAGNPAVFRPCPRESVEAGMRDAQMKRRFKTGPDAREVAAFRRIVEKADALAVRVVYLRMPVTSLWSRTSGDFGFEKLVRETLGGRWLELSNETWGVTDADFFGATGREACNLDKHHLNPLAAIRFTRELAARITRSGVSARQ